MQSKKSSAEFSTTPVHSLHQSYEKYKVRRHNTKLSKKFEIKIRLALQSIINLIDKSKVNGVDRGKHRSFVQNAIQHLHIKGKVR